MSELFAWCASAQKRNPRVPPILGNTASCARSLLSDGSRALSADSRSPSGWSEREAEATHHLETMGARHFGRFAPTAGRDESGAPSGGGRNGSGSPNGSRRNWEWGTARADRCSAGVGHSVPTLLCQARATPGMLRGVAAAVVAHPQRGLGRLTNAADAVEVHRECYTLHISRHRTRGVPAQNAHVGDGAARDHV